MVEMDIGIAVPLTARADQGGGCGTILGEKAVRLRRKRLRGRPASMTQTFRRLRASCMAADNPAKLPPTIRASYTSWF